MEIIFSEKCFEYKWPGHIERPERMSVGLGILQENYNILESETASEKDLLTVHTNEHVNRVKNAGPWCALDPDTPAPEGIYSHALLSAGATMLAAEKKLFHTCVLLGTMLDLRVRLWVLELHRHPAYPYTGFASNGNCLNYPLPYSAGNNMYMKTLRKALSEVKMDKIELIAISAGFDTHEGDIVSLGLTGSSYREIGRIVGSLNKPLFGTLEGGYIGEYVGADVHELLSGIEEVQ
ncbi:MAG: hypothetical protein P8X84_02845 [Candidatus Bathyarchaeota archaeon]